MRLHRSFHEQPLYGQVISDNITTGDGESELTPERQKISNTSL